jgi:ketosteroid isomerase-like protein
MTDTRWAVRIALVALLAAAASCGGRAPPPQTPPAAPEPVDAAPAPPPEPPPEPVHDAPPPKASPETLAQATMKDLADALRARDAQKASALFADQGSVAAYGAWEAHGRDAIAKRLQDFFAAFADAKFAVLRAWAKGDVIIQESAWAGTMTGDFMGRSPSHAAAGQILAQVFAFDAEGRVKELHVYADDAGLLAQLSGKKDAPPVPLLPTNEANVHVSSESPDEDNLVKWWQAYDDALSQGDASAVVAGLAEDADVWVSAFGKPAMRGRKVLSKEIAGWAKAFPDQKWTTTGAWGIDGFAIVEHSMTGTQKRPFGSLKASSKPITDWHWLTIAQPNGDQEIHHVWAHANLHEVLRQTGALEASPKKAPAAPRNPPPPAPAPTPGH